MAYVEVLASGVKFDAPMDETYAKLGMDPSDVTSLEENLEEYFSKILKKLKEVGGGNPGRRIFTCKRTEKLAETESI